MTSAQKLLDRRKQTELQWFQNPSETNGDNANNVRREARRTFRHKKGIKVKVNLSPCLTKHHVVKAYWESGNIAPRIFNLVARWR